MFDAASKQATLTWSDTFAAGTTYSIEQQAADGTWSSLDAVPGTSGTGSQVTWQRTINAAATLRVAATESGYSVPLVTPGGNTSVTVAPPATTPTIALSQTQPVSGSVTLTIANGSTYSVVQWFVDLNSLGSSTTGPGYGIGLDAGTLTAGNHLILAQLESSPDSYVQIRLTITAQNPEVTMNAHVDGTAGTVYLTVIATSASGIVSVSATLDGNSLGTLTAPKCYTAYCGNAYQFPIDATAAGSGLHTVSAVATDGNGISASQTFQVTFSDPPRLTVTTPFDGALVNGTLTVNGTFATDRAGVTVSVAATLGSVTVLNSNKSPFSGSFDLTGVTPGTYTLTVIATDSTGLTTTVSDTVTVTSSPSLVYTPLLTLGANSAILAVAASNFLYQDQSGGIHVHTPSSDTTLSLGTLTDPFDKRITDGGYVFIDAFGKDRSAQIMNVYMWTPGATTATNLSLAVGSRGDDQLVSVHFPWVLWASTESGDAGYFRLYNVTTGKSFTVPTPAGSFSVANISCDFVTINGSLTLFFWAEFQNVSAQYVTNVYRWSQATGITTQLSNDGLSLYPQTDGTTVAWQTNHTALQFLPPFTLTTFNIASGSIATLSTNTTDFYLNAGLLGWAEQTTSGTGENQSITAQSIKASNGAMTSTLTNLLSSVLFGSSGGYVAYEDSQQLYDWSPAGGSTVLFNGAPAQVHLTGSTLYFTSGASQVLYSVSMH